MQLTKNYSPDVLKAGVNLLAMVYPELTPSTLVDALRAYGTKSQKPKAKETVTIQEASDILGVTKVSIHRYIKQGLLPRIKISAKNVKIPLDAIQELLTVEEV